ncbi:MAG: lipoyl(octanoyl) transferase [Chthoniobacter sp.]|jgi:lipoyl(octanoyl) transferase|nr:lipoyl(octanoyl) transferase [Chthoniobacter sp.]
MMPMHATAPESEAVVGKPRIETRWLGRVAYPEALALQEELVRERAETIQNPKSKTQNRDVLLLLEHDPVYTIGRTPDQSSLRDPSQLPHPIVQTNRGGQATFHGPGQLIGYPILDLRERGEDLHRYLRTLENILIETCRVFGVAAHRREKLTGVWVEDRKIASIGVGIRNWITMHGFALNVCGDLSPFSAITPCGIAGVQMTSLERESVNAASVETVAAAVSEIFAEQI